MVRFGRLPMTRKRLASLLQQNQPQATLDAPFPQADRLLHLFSLLEEIAQAKNLSGKAITEVQDFDRRQAAYYSNAGKWLGRLKKENQEFLLTDAGRRLVQAPLSGRVQQTFTVLCQRPVFHQALAWWLQHRALPDTAQIVPWLEEAVRRGQIRPLSQSTLKRRAQTVRGWLKVIVPWIQA